MSKPAISDQRAALMDLGLFLAAMFLIRELEVPGLGFFGHALMYSLVTLVVATWRLRVRGQSWRSVGLLRPESLSKMAAVTVLILVLVVASVVFFEFILELLFSSADADPSTASTDSRSDWKAGLEDNLVYFFSIIFIVWIESFLEELNDRGFLLSRLEILFSRIPFSTVLAVVSQAAIFGYRHSASRDVHAAIVVGIIGLVMGFAYVAFGRNLWALIIAHCFLNTMSMVERYLGET
ncbi:MAG TPA: CPBP family intramembrane metalloprotease [Planctomycetes bacterium]|nr:CPBP family intramembrane metalloprotease [Planctomycetota bacterium]